MHLAITDKDDNKQPPYLILRLFLKCAEQGHPVLITYVCRSEIKFKVARPVRKRRSSRRRRGKDLQSLAKIIKVKDKFCRAFQMFWYRANFHTTYRTRTFSTPNHLKPNKNLQLQNKTFDFNFTGGSNKEFLQTTFAYCHPLHKCYI